MSGFLSSSIGRKVVMSLTGLFLIVFLLVHLGVNLTLFLGAETFNATSHFMAKNPLIQVMRYVLAAAFIFHIIQGIVLSLKNNAARPINYVKNNAKVSASWESRNMLVTGIVVLLFLGLHMKDYVYPITFVGVADDYILVTTLFKNPLYVAIYILAFIFLTAHLLHGFQSAFTSLGARHPKYLKCVVNLGTIFSILIGIGFSAIALYFYFV